jgi:hypothetical protein
MNFVASVLAKMAPVSVRRKAAWNPNTAFGVTQMRSRGTVPMIMEQADRHLPSMMTSTPESVVDWRQGKSGLTNLAYGNHIPDCFEERRPPAGERKMLSS